MTKGSIKINPGKVSVVVHQPIQTSAYTRETKEALMERVRRILCDGLENIETGNSVC
jgi:hypothetical protein